MIFILGRKDSIFSMKKMLSLQIKLIVQKNEEILCIDTSCNGGNFVQE